MNKTEIYYFSGTGNSLAAARVIAGKTDGKLIPVSSVIGRDKIETDADVIGIVFPIYYVINTGLPVIISKFAKKLSGGIGAKYIFAAGTCGGGSGSAFINLKKIIKMQGGKLSAGFTVVMTSNLMTASTDKRMEKLDASLKKLDEVSGYVNERKHGKFETANVFMRILSAILMPVLAPVIKANLRKMLKSEGTTFDEIIYNSDNSYYTDENCDGCGTCAKVCPVNNIKIAEGKPSWQHHCETCVACVNFCPNHAIHGGLPATMKNYDYYHHPEIKAADLFSRK